MIDGEFCCSVCGKPSKNNPNKIEDKAVKKPATKSRKKKK